MQGYLYGLLLVILVLSALGVIGLVLLQHGKGADMGASFGSGASGSLFGATGSANFLSRSTAILATVFFVTCIVLAAMQQRRPAGVSGGVMNQVPADAPAPTAPAPAPAKPAGSAADEIPK